MKSIHYTYCFLTLWIMCMFNAHSSIRTKRFPQNTYLVILAGGKGTRLWPLSRERKPKQFLSLGDENHTLLDQTILRFSSFIPQERMWIITMKEHEEAISKGLAVGRIVIEPSAQNTGPAVAYCCAQIIQEDPDAYVIFAHADAFIPADNNEDFAQRVQHALCCAQEQDSICLLGVRPTFPATGYGYIEYTADKCQESFKVRAFHEKPSQERAQEYLMQENILWNIGVFVGTAQRFIKEFDTHAPAIMQHIRTYMQGTSTYQSVPPIAIDYAIMEKSDRIWVTPSSFSWCDVGNVATFLSLKNQYSRVDNLILIDAQNNLVDVPEKEKLVALIDVDDLCVVQTQDALLITKRESAEKVRHLVSLLKQQNLNHYL